MQFIHIIITVCLGQNRCRRNGKKLTVSFYHGSVRHILIFMKPITIYQQMLRTDLQLVNSPMHR